MKKLLIATTALIAVSFVAADSAEAGHRHHGRHRDSGLNVAFGGDNWQVSFGSPYRGQRGFYGPRPYYPRQGYGCGVPVYPRPYWGRRPAVIIPPGPRWGGYPGAYYRGHH